MMILGGDTIIIQGNSVTAANGLSMAGKEVRLGNTPLIEPTTISGNAQQMTISDLHTFYLNVADPEFLESMSILYWQNELLPTLRRISEFHPQHYEIPKEVTCTDAELAQQWQSVVLGAYKQFESTCKGGSIGIDCSGFVYTAYSEDKQLLMNAKKLNSGSGAQLEAFKKAEQQGNAFVHKDFNLVSAGDLIHKKGHVMIATGNVQRDNNGKVIMFETLEANSTDIGSVKMWRKVIQAIQ